LGTKPNGEIIKSGKGGTPRGPAVWPMASSFANLALTAAGFWRADLRLGDCKQDWESEHWIEKPYVKPLMECLAEKSWQFPGLSLLKLAL